MSTTPASRAAEAPTNIQTRCIGPGVHEVSDYGDVIATVILYPARWENPAGWYVKTHDYPYSVCPIARSERFGTLRAAVNEIARTVR